MAAAGPATVAAVAALLRRPVDDPDLVAPVAAVNAFVARLPYATETADDGTVSWADDVTHGAELLAARVYRRRNSPAGVEAVSELGAIYVQRNDPDVAQLLGLGVYARPIVG